MIKMGEITCRIPSNGVKPGILYCTEPEALKLDVWMATAAWATALLTLGLLVAAIWAAVAANRTLSQMKRESEARSRPYLYAQLVPSIGGIGTFDLVITNSGQSSAKKVTATLAPGPHPDQSDSRTEDIKMLLSTEQTIPPMTQIRAYWLTVPSGAKRELKLAGGEIVPHFGIIEPTEIHLEYSDDNTAKKVPYKDSYLLDISTVRKSPAPSTGPEMPAGLRTSDQAIYKMLAQIVGQLGWLRR